MNGAHQEWISASEHEAALSACRANQIKVNDAYWRLRGALNVIVREGMTREAMVEIARAVLAVD